MRKDAKTKRNNAQVAHRKRRRRRRKQNRVLHYLVLLIFLVGAAAGLSTTVLFKIEEIEVIGVDRYTPDEIAAASGVHLQDNLLRIDKKEIETQILEQFPYIETVETRRKLPPKVEIAVTQAAPVGAIAEGDELLLVGANGKVLERGRMLVPNDVLLVKGVDAGSAQPGDFLGEYEPKKPETEAEIAAEEKRKEQAEMVQEKLGMMQYLLRAIEESDFTGLTNVDLTDRLNIRIMYEDRILLELGSENELPYKLYFVKYVLEHSIAPDAVGVLNATEAAKRRISFQPEGGAGTDVFEADKHLPQPEEDDKEDETTDTDSSTQA